MLFWHIFTKLNIISTPILHMLKSLTHGKYKLLISQKNISSQNFMGSMPTFT